MNKRKRGRAARETGPGTSRSQRTVRTTPLMPSPAEIGEFINVEVCICAALVSMVGYASFNPPSADMLYLSLASFFSVAAAYGYNSVADGREDKTSLGRPRSLSSGREASVLIAVCFAGGAFFSYWASLSSFISYALITSVGLAYSLLRLRRILLVKNAYSAILMGLFYAYGASSGPVHQTQQIVSQSLFVAGFFFIGALIADLRDYHAEIRLGHPTLPHVAGKDATRYAIYVLMAIFTAYILVMNMSSYYSMIPFFALAALFMGMENYHVSHICYMYALVFAAVGTVGSRLIASILIR